MSRNAKESSQPLNAADYHLPKDAEDWHLITSSVAQRYNLEYRQQTFQELPSEVESMPVFQDWAAGRLQARIASPFWELTLPKKNQHWLDVGCGLSFLIYPWREWGTYFYGQEISTVAQEALKSRGPQLNSKLFKGVELGGGHTLHYENQQFDGMVATGWSCYYPLDYWQTFLSEARRVLKPGGLFVFDVVNPEQDLAENWAILETYLGAEVMLPALSDWKTLVREAGGTITKTRDGELFQALQVKF
jgi:SAM-dependent methyltransferase